MHFVSLATARSCICDWNFFLKVLGIIVLGLLGILVGSEDPGSNNQKNIWPSRYGQWGYIGKQMKECAKATRKLYMRGHVYLRDPSVIYVSAPSLAT